MTIIELELIENEDNKKLCESIMKMFSTVPQGMTSFQIQNFVLSDLEFPTIDSKWWQSKLELWVRMQSIIYTHYDYRKKVAKIKELKSDIDELEYNNSKLGEDTKSKIQAERNISIIEYKTVEIEENEFNIMYLKKGISDKVKEIISFWEMMKKLEPEMKFSKDDKEEQEKEYWTKKALSDQELVVRHREVFTDSKEVVKRYRNLYKPTS